MKRWEAPDSIFAPLIAAVPPGTHWSGFGNALIAAAGSIPHSEVGYTVKKPGSLRWIRETHQRMLLTTSGDNAAPFSTRAFLLDKPPGRKVTGLATVRLWEVGMTHLKDGLCAPAVPEKFDSAILQLAKFQFTQTGVYGAPQLALIRHLWAEAVFSASPEAIVFGGQHHWLDGWWTERLAEGAED